MEQQLPKEFTDWVKKQGLPTSSIEYAFQHYLLKVGLWGVPLPPVQIRETRRAFYAGATALFADLVEMAGWEEGQAEQMLELRGQELEMFWAVEDLARKKSQN